MGVTLNIFLSCHSLPCDEYKCELSIQVNWILETFLRGLGGQGAYSTGLPILAERVYPSERKKLPFLFFVLKSNQKAALVKR